jgi:GT2 family glycosyltransferase
MIEEAKPLISVIVTNYNGWELGVLKDFFDTFLSGDFKDFEVFLVDMASTDGSVEKVKANFGKDKRLQIIQNLINNMSAGIDMALKKAKGKYVFFLNNDIYFEKGAIKKMVNFMNMHPEAGQIQGKIVSYFDHKKIDSVGESMDIYGNPVTLGVGEVDRGQYDKLTEVLSVTGASALFRAGLIDKVGILDPDYGIGYEDMDLSLRLRLLGYKMYYLPGAIIYHRRGSSTSRVSLELKAKIKFWFNKNRIATIIKNYSLSNILRSLPVVILIYIFSGLFEIFYKRLWRFGLTRFQAIVWMFADLPQLLDKRSKIQKIRKLPDNVALTPFMTKGVILGGFKGFLRSSKW